MASKESPRKKIGKAEKKAVAAALLDSIESTPAPVKAQEQLPKQGDTGVENESLPGTSKTKATSTEKELKKEMRRKAHEIFEQLRSGEKTMDEITSDLKNSGLPVFEAEETMRIMHEIKKREDDKVGKILQTEAAIVRNGENRKTPRDMQVDEGVPTSRIPETGQPWMRPGVVETPLMRTYSDDRQEQQKTQMDTEEANQKEVESSDDVTTTPATPVSTPEAANMEKREKDEKQLRRNAIRILGYREIGISDEDIAKHLQERGLGSEAVRETMNLMNSIQASRTEKAERQALEQERSRTIERREARSLGASLGQVETRKGAAYQQQDEEMPLGRERIPSVPVDEGLMIQVETRKPGDAPAVSDAEPESDVDTSGVVNPFMLKPDAQTDLDALVADVHAAAGPPVEMVLPAQAEDESSDPTEFTPEEAGVIRGDVHLPTIRVDISTNPTAEEQRQLVVDRELDTFRREGWVQSMPTVERTPKEWRERLRSLISSVKEKITPGERSEKMKAYLASRAEALGETAKEYGPRVEEFIRAKGEEYNRLSLTKKILVGGVLGVGAAAFSGVSTPLATAFAINLGIQRVAGMSSMFLKIEKYLQDHKGSNIGLGPLRIRDEKIKGAAAFGAVAYTALMGAAIGESVHLASESAYGQAVHEWLGRMLGHEPSSLAPAPQELPVAASVVQAPSEVVVPQPAEAASSAPEGIAEKALDAPAAQPAAVAAAGEAPAGISEVASIDVKATPGKGYEYMTKRLWEQLQEKNIKLPSGANPDSDLAKLLAADKDSIDKIVHQLAQENEFFKNTGQSVRINLDSHMSIDANGNILLNDPTLASEARNLAPENAPVTPAYHPEAPAYPATEGSGPVQDVLPDMPEEGPAGIAGTTATETTVEQFPSSDILIENQSPAPVIVRDFVVNKFDVAVPLAEPHIYAGPSGTNQVFAFGGEKMIRLNAMFEYLKAHPNAVVIAEDDSGNYRATWTLVKDRLVQGERLPKSGFFGRLSGAFLPPPGPDELSKLIK